MVRASKVEGVDQPPSCGVFRGVSFSPDVGMFSAPTLGVCLEKGYGAVGGARRLTFSAFRELCERRMVDCKTRSSKRRCSRCRFVFLTRGAAAVVLPVPPSALSLSST